MPESSATKDHPRGCGAHTSTDRRCARTSGSSPRVRGSHMSLDSCPVGPGIIPAGAGLTYICIICIVIQWDHPRGCGAHSTDRAILTRRQGSSPRVRGSLYMAFTAMFMSGIIPAGAGLTLGAKSRATMRRDHPRGCGAHLYTSNVYLYISGSSPRVRGSLC